MELPHWLMAIGAIFLMVGFFGSVLHQNTVVTSEPDPSEGDQVCGPPNPPSAAAAP
jgi:hypothetical protein